MLHTAPSILCVTDRTLCPEHFLSQISRIAAAGPAGVILREKDLCESAYRALAAQVLSLCRQHQVPCILHTFPSAARALGATALHLPLPLLRAMPKEERAAFSSLGTSCHSVAEALEAQALGATYLLAGHIFDTSCKPGLPGGDWISWPRSAPLSPCLFTPLAASRRKPSPGCAGPGPEAPAFGAAS